MLNTGSEATETTLDRRLVWAMAEGRAVLPEDLGILQSYLRLIDGLLAEKAGELAPTWREACSDAAEIDTLQLLEATVVERGIAICASCIGDMRVKLEIWRGLAAGDADNDMSSPGNRMILSIVADLDCHQRSWR